MNSDWDNEEFLRHEYHDKGKGMKEIAQENGTNYNKIRAAMVEYGIERRGANETRYFEKRQKIQEYKEEIIESYVKHNEPMYKIGQSYGVNDATIKRYLHEWGIDTRGIQEQHLRNTDYPKLNDNDWLKEQYREKERFTPDIARELGCSDGTVYNALKRHGIEIWDHGHTIEGENSHIWGGDDVEFTCEYCGESEMVRPHVKRVKQYCSKECRAAYMSEYMSGENWPNFEGGGSQYYGPNWQNIREECMKNDGYECRICSKTRKECREQHGRDLDIHHIRPLREFDSYKEANKQENLVALCANCHSRWEGIPVVPQ